MMEVFDAIRTLLAVRRYQDRAVPDTIVRKIVEAGRLTGSAMNLQPWHFVVVQDRETLRKLGALARSGEEAEQWRMTEEMLANALRRNEIPFEVNPGEGAFYGPKIEIYVPDALKRKWQLATIQLDYNMPERFDLSYTTNISSEARPVMIHRAILGSLERFIGVLIEHTGGVLPLWLAPEQVRVLSLSEKVEDYAGEVATMLKAAGFRAAADIRNEKLGFKVREAELAKVPYMVVVGEREAAARQVSLRLLRGSKGQTLELAGLIEHYPRERVLILQHESCRNDHARRSAECL